MANRRSVLSVVQPRNTVVVRLKLHEEHAVSTTDNKSRFKDVVRWKRTSPPPHAKLSRLTGGVRLLLHDSRDYEGLNQVEVTPDSQSLSGGTCSYRLTVGNAM